MRSTLALGTILLSCCLAAVAQMGSTPNQTPPSSTPSTFPQDRTGQTPSNPSTPADPSAIPPDTSATGGMSHDHADQASSQSTTVQGCLSQSADGSFILADNSGNSFQLHGENSKLTSYVGKEVRVNGVAAGSGGSSTGAMASPSSAPGAAQQFSVSNVKKIADACATGTGMTTK